MLAGFLPLKNILGFHMTATSPVALVTGGGTGVGQATVLRLAKLGYRVVVNYSRSQKEAADTVAEVGQGGGEALAIAADVADDAAVRKMVAETVDRWKRIDVLVNCAGTTDFIPFHSLDDVTDDVWERLMKVNVVGAFHCARAVREPMLAVGGGQIVNVSSVAALLAQGSSIPYCCSKAALDNLTVSLARTFAPKIRVNAIAPGFIANRWTQAGLGDRYDGIKSAYEKTLPLKKVCTPDDIAAGVLSLITGSPLVTGQTLVVDGGMMIAGYQIKFD